MKWGKVATAFVQSAAKGSPIAAASRVRKNAALPAGPSCSAKALTITVCSRENTQRNRGNLRAHPKGNLPERNARDTKGMVCELDTNARQGRFFGSVLTGGVHPCRCSRRPARSFPEAPNRTRRSSARLSRASRQRCPGTRPASSNRGSRSVQREGCGRIRSATSAKRESTA
jgi:hypothetical protein